MSDQLTPTAVIFGLVGLALHLVLGFLVLVSGLVAPIWAVIGMAIGWLAALVYGVTQWHGSIKVALAVPVVGWLTWIGVLLLGDRFLGWTA